MAFRGTGRAADAGRASTDKHGLASSLGGRSTATTPRGATSRQGPVAAKPKAGASSRTGLTSSTVTSRMREANKPKNLRLEIEKLDASNAELEKEIEDLEAQVALAEAEAATAAEKEKEAEEKLIARSAEVAEEYAAGQERVRKLEADLEDVTAKLDAQKTKNKELCCRNIELDKEFNMKQKLVTEAEAELKRISKSQEQLDEELERQYANCERIKYMAELQGDKCEEDIQRMQSRIQQISQVAGADAEEVVQLVRDTETIWMPKVQEAKQYCMRLKVEGPQPDRAAALLGA